MTGMPWFRFFPSDWLGGTRGLTSSEAGVYITLIALMYERGGKIEANHARLSRLCGASNSAFGKAMETLIDDEKIVVIDGLYTNKRVLEELSYRSEKEEVAKKAAKSRWEEKPTKSTEEPKRTDSDSNAIPEARSQMPEVSKKEPKGSTKAEDVLNELRKVLDEDRARAIVEHRKGFKAKFTAYAARLLAGKFAKCPDPNAAADTMIANGWQGFEVDWMERHTNRDGRLGRAQQKPSERYDPFKALAQEMQDEQNGRDSSSSGDWDDAEGVPILTIDYDGR
jgi:uncharacterized protein YdaU (DUF1376 family)